MKCLLCGIVPDKDEMIKHYITFHRVDANNYFFKYLFLTSNESLCIECCRCNGFITTKEHHRRHNFLEHYSEGKKLPFEEKPIEIKELQELTTYEISSEKHGDYYNFSAPKTLIEEFLLNVRHRFKAIGKDVAIKCGFFHSKHTAAPYKLFALLVN